MRHITFALLVLASGFADGAVQLWTNTPGQTRLGREEYLLTDTTHAVEITATAETPLSVNFPSITNDGINYRSERFSLLVNGTYLGQDLVTRTRKMWPEGGRYYRNTAPTAFVFPQLGRPCGRMWVHEFERDGNGIVTKAAIDYAPGCDEYMGPTGATDTSRAQARIRYNSDVPLFPVEPFAAVEQVDEREDGEAVVLDGRMSRAGADPIVAWRWEQTAGAPLNLTSADQPVAGFVVPQLPFGGSDIVVRLTVTDNAGRSASTEFRQHLASKSDLRTTLRFHTVGPDVPESLATPQYIAYGPDGGAVSGLIQSFDPYNGWLDQFRLILAAAPTDIDDRYLQAQLFIRDRRIPRLGVDEPLSTDGSNLGGKLVMGSGCQPLGSINIREAGVVAAEPFSDLRRATGLDYVYTYLRLAFDIHCQQQVPVPDPLRTVGELRFRAYAEGVPTALTPSALTGIPGANIVLDGSDTIDDGPANQLTYAWTQLEGPSVQIVDASSATAHFTAPTLAPGSFAVLRFELLVTDADGYMNRRELTVMLSGDADVGLMQVPPPGGEGLPDVFNTRQDEWFMAFNDGVVDSPLKVTGRVLSPSTLYRASFGGVACAVAAAFFDCPAVTVPGGFGMLGYVIVDAPHRGTIKVETEVNGHLPDLNPANDVLLLTETQEADMSILSQSAPLSTQKTKKSATYHFTVANGAGFPVPDVSVNFTISGPGTLTAFSLPGAACTITQTAARCQYAMMNVTPGAPAVASLTVKAGKKQKKKLGLTYFTITGTIASPSPDPRPNNSASARVQIK